MRPLKASTQRVVRIGPVVDSTTFAPKADLAYNASGIHACITKAGATSHTNLTLANSAGDGYFVADVEGYYFLTLTTGETDTPGSAIVNLSATGFIMPPQFFCVYPAMQYDSMIAGSDYLQVDAVQISGDVDAADNLELAYDGTGYAGGATKQVVEVNTKTGFALSTAGAEAVSDKVWDEATADHAEAGSTGLTLSDGYAKTVDIHGTDLPTVAADALAAHSVIDDIHDVHLPAIGDTMSELATSNQAVAIAEVLGDIHDTDLPAVKTVADDVKAFGAPPSESTIATAVVNAIRDLATYGLIAINTLLVTTGIKAASIPAVTGATLHTDYDHAKDDVVTPLAVVDGILDDIHGADLPALKTVADAAAADALAAHTKVDTLENLEWLYVPPT